MIHSFLYIFVLNVFVSKNELFSDFLGELQFQSILIMNVSNFRSFLQFFTLDQGLQSRVLVQLLEIIC